MVKRTELPDLDDGQFRQANHRQRLPGCVRFFIVIDAIVFSAVLLSCGYLYFQFRLIPYQSRNSGFIEHLASGMGQSEAEGGDEFIPFKIAPLIDFKEITANLAETNKQTPQDTEEDINLPTVMNQPSSIDNDRLEKEESIADFYGIDFGAGQERIIVTITPSDQRVNRGEPIFIPFYPSHYCEFGDKTGCVTTYQSDRGGKIIFVSVHSGVGGQAQGFRNAIEGTGINTAGYDLEKVQNKLSSLNGAQITIRQGDEVVNGFRIVGTSRIPASLVGDYLSVPATGGLEFASGLDPAMAGFVNPDTPQLVIETCGWKMRGEPGTEEVAPTTASIYLVVIQKVD